MSETFNANPCPVAGCGELAPCPTHGRVRQLDELGRLGAAVHNAGVLLAHLAATGPGLIRRSKIDSRRDGMPGGGFEHVGADPVLWCESHLCEVGDCRKAGLTCDGVPVDTVSDPTGEAAIARVGGGHRDDATEKAVRRMLRLVEAAVVNLGLAADAGPGFGAWRPAEPDDEMWCASCKRVKSWSQRFRGDLCNWCYKNRRPGLLMPPVELVDKHVRGLRITSSDWAKHGYQVA